MTEFAVRAKDFATYQKFAKKVNTQGWVYADHFIKFFESAMLFNDCLYFSNKFDGYFGERTPKYRFSNVNDDEVTLIFNLDSKTGFEQAVLYAYNQYAKHVLRK